MTRMPDPNSVGDDTLLRLGVAAALEFPDGSMGASGLRREAQHGRLRIWRIAGKDYTTKQALREMRGQCVLPSHQDLNCGRPEKAAMPRGSSKTESAKSAQALAKANRQERANPAIVAGRYPKSALTLRSGRSAVRPTGLPRPSAIRPGPRASTRPARRRRAARRDPR